VNSESVCVRAGITYRNLDYWCRAGYLPTSERHSHLGSGYPRDFTEAEAEHVAALARLVKAGIRLDVASKALREQTDDGAIPASLILPGGVTVTTRSHLAAVS
jgi:DNA-binding transcriptional MerR regulator